MSYGDINEDFYDVLGDANHDAVVEASNDERIYQILKERLRSVLVEFAGLGWGMEEHIADEYYSIPWIEEDEGKQRTNCKSYKIIQSAGCEIII